jgi:FixJ family two-component response regulator
MEKIVHGLRNKLTIIMGQTFKLSKKYGNEDFLTISEATEQLETLIASLPIELNKKVNVSVKIAHSNADTQFVLQDNISNQEGLIYIIDDELNLLSVLTDMISPYGFSIKQFSNGQEAATSIKKDRPDLIISDINMPNMDGIELLKYCNDNNIDSPIIFISGMLSKEIMLDCINHGAYGFIEKPFKEALIVSNTINAVKKAKEQRKMSKSINSVIYQFDDIDKKLDLLGEDDLRLALKTEIENIRSLKKLLKG